jgi:hypothetical protein
VHDDGRDEQQCRPVVQLPHEQAAADVEGELQGRVVGRRHLYTAQGRVAALVDDLLHGGVEEERQVGARQQRDEEGVEGDLAEQERPVVGVDLVQRPPEPRGDEHAVVDLDAGLAELGGGGSGCSGGASHQMRSRFQ